MHAPTKPAYLELLPFGREHEAPPRADGRPRTYQSGPGRDLGSYNEATCTRILQAIAVGATFDLAAAYGGISEMTFNTWRTRYPEFDMACRMAHGEGALALLAKIQQAANEGDWRAAGFLLDRRFQEQYGRKDRNLGGGGTNNVQVSVYLPTNTRFAAPDAAPPALEAAYSVEPEQE